MTWSIARSGLSKRGRASCLSELPMMPLDILFEIFSHLHPSDLLSLSRVNKAFRFQLLSSGSSSLWNTCFRLCSAPTTPVDMSPASWANLLFGGAYCYVSNFCSNELSTIKIKYKPHGPELWRETSNQSSICISPSCVQVLHHNPSTLYQRASQQLIPVESLIGSVGKLCCTRHWWDEDVTAFEAELNALKNPVSDPADAEATISAFLAKKKASVTAITEHAHICATWEKDRNTDRGIKLSDVRDKRFEDIKARLLPLGYLEKDVNQLRLHREVRMGKPLWKRVEPLLLSKVNEARDRRPVLEGGEDYKLRRQRAIADYSNFLKISPILLAHSPSGTRSLCEDQALASALAPNNGPDDRLSEVGSLKR
ncbi:hypothetical protein BGY98DRAFT_1098786 [Russula aff. rugulosa BPL654]|nr:hypothetical protein BGY98DRAFT_1098786 [Russula aff. rugulosa BPL654]